MSVGEKIDTRRHSIGLVEIYELTSDELDRIETEAMSVGQDLQYCSICLTAGLSFLIALITTEIKSIHTYAIFFVLTVSGLLFATYFGQKFFRDRKKCKSVIQRIRDRQVGPIGEQGKEIGAAVAATLPLTTASTESNTAPPTAEGVGQ